MRESKLGETGASCATKYSPLRRGLKSIQMAVGMLNVPGYEVFPFAKGTEIAE